MGKERFKRVKLNELIPWQRFTYKLVAYYNEPDPDRHKRLIEAATLLGGII